MNVRESKIRKCNLNVSLLTTNYYFQDTYFLQGITCLYLILCKSLCGIMHSVEYSCMELRNKHIIHIKGSRVSTIKM